MIHKLSSAPVLLFLLAIIAYSGVGQAGEDSLANLAPTAGDLEGWAPAGAIQVYEGLDLFELINGGAELYHEYGFRRVLSRDYGGPEGRFITLEIYEMESAASAYGIYSFKTDPGGERIAVGTEAMLEGYYLNIWKDRFLVTLTGLDSEEATRAGLVRIGRAVVGKIPAGAPRPALTRLLPLEPQRPVKVWYLRGDLALANIASFAQGCSFRMSEGVAADYGDHRVYVLAYADQAQARERFEAVAEKLRKRRGPESTGAEDESTRMMSFADEKGETVSLEQLAGHILVTVAQDRAEAGLTAEALRSRLTSAAGER